MGVVRDVTIDNLTQAVQGISSTGISDSTGQAINNTLATLGKDTSLQGIISAINALGQLLGNDKVNISGDNIANPSAFRHNIGIYTGQVITDDDSTSVKTGSNYQVGLSLNLPAGSWYVLASCRAELKSINGRIMSNIGRNTTFTTADYFTQSCYNIKDVKLRVQTSAIVRPSETTTYNYVLYSDDSTAIYDLFHIIAIRII